MEIQLECCGNTKAKRHILVAVLAVFFLTKAQVVFADDHGNTPGAATPIPVGSATVGILELGKDVDFFVFSVNVAGWHYFGARGSTATVGRLYDSTVTQIASDDDSGEGENFRIAAYLTPGVYYVAVSGDFSSTTGLYTFHVEGPAAGSLSDDHGLSPWSATTVVIGSATSGTLNAGDDRDFFKVTVATAGWHYFTARGATATVGRLFDSTISQIASDDDSGEDENFRIVVYLTPGVYHVEVSGDFSTTTGAYTFHVEGPGAGSIGDDHGLSPWSATAAVIGSATSGTLNAGDDRDYLRVNVASAGWHYFTARGTTATVGRLYDSTITQIASDDDSGESENFRIVVYLAPGIYYIEVSGDFSTTTGNYTFHVEGPGAGSLGDDHGLSPWSATPVEIGSATNGTLNAGDDRDYFKVTVTNAGWHYFTARGATATVGRLYDSTISQIASDDDSGEDENFRMVVYLTPGVYYIEVSGDFSTTTGNYTFHVEGPGAGSLGDDHGLSPWSATPVAIGSATSGTLNAGDDRDYFKVTVIIAGWHYFTARGATATFGALADSTLTLLSSDDDSGEDENFRIAAYLTPGVYYVAVSGDFSTTTGAYTLHGEGPGAGSVGDDHGLSPWSATAVAVGSATSGTLNAGDDRDYFRVTVTNGGWHFFTARGAAATVGRLFDSTITQIAGDDDSGEGENFRIAAYLTPGVYYVEVSGDFSTTTGAYVFHVEGPGAGSLSDDHGLSPWSATPVPIGSITSGTLNVGDDRDYFKLTVTSAGWHYFITQGTTATVGRLYDATLTQIATDDDSGAGDNFQVVAYLIPGDYYLAVSGDFSTTTGAYTFVAYNWTSLNWAGALTNLSLPTYTAPAMKQGGKDKLVVVTHGWQKWPLPVDVTWVSNLASSISQRVGGDWQVVPYLWTEKAHTLFPSSALLAAGQEGRSLGIALSTQQWTHVHFIAHSAGAHLIDEAARTMKQLSPATTTHTTFLDPYTRLFTSWRLRYGSWSTWSDNYFTVDALADFGETRTGGKLSHAYNVDVSWLDPDKITVPVTDGSCGLTYCGSKAVPNPDHGWAHEFYHGTVTGGLAGCPDLASQGFALSSEAGGWTAATNLARGLDPIELCNPSGGFPLVSAPPELKTIHNLSSLVSGGSISSPITVAGSGFTMQTASPAWLSFYLIVTNPVNFVTFDALFASPPGAQGLLTVYWDTNEIGYIDERVALQESQEYSFALPEAVAEGSHVLAFRLDPFTATNSSIVVTNVATGFSGPAAWAFLPAVTPSRL